MYGIAEGSTSTGANSTMIFKADLELNFQWAMAFNHTIFGNRGFEIDSTDTHLYFSLQVSDWILGRMFTENGTIEYAKLIISSISWDMVISKDDQFAYTILLLGKFIALLYAFKFVL